MINGNEQNSYDPWEEYAKIWDLAYEAGATARKDGLSRNCNLSDSIFCTTTNIVLKPYKSAWEEGWNS